MVTRVNGYPRAGFPKQVDEFNIAHRNDNRESLVARLKADERSASWITFFKGFPESVLYISRDFVLQIWLASNPQVDKKSGGSMGHVASYD
jgi:hypothetical protein